MGQGDCGGQHQANVGDPSRCSINPVKRNRLAHARTGNASGALPPQASRIVLGGPFVLGGSHSPAANPVAKKAQSKSLEGAQGTLPFCCRLASLRRGAALAPLRSTPKYLAPPSRRAGPLCFAPRRRPCSRHWIKSKNSAAPAVKREAEED
jgi:hypothetical protein